jgi:ribosomal-protein-alanine N-acetyltransferase
MMLLPIDIDEALNSGFNNNPECAAVLSVYPGYYNRIGFIKPWIGYLATEDGNEIIGCGGFKGKPVGNKVEIAYGTFKNYEGRGVATKICRQLVLLSLKTDPSIRITARTFLETNASARVLKKNGFECSGIVYDEEDGNVWEWELKKVPI